MTSLTTSRTRVSKSVRNVVCLLGSAVRSLKLPEMRFFGLCTLFGLAAIVPRSKMTHRTTIFDPF